MTTQQAGILITYTPEIPGGVARELTRQLVAHGYRVTVMTNGSDGARVIRGAGGLPAYSSLTRAGEIRSMLKAANAQVIVNLAPQSMNHVPALKTVWDESVLSDGTAAVIDAAKEAGVEYLLHTSYSYVGGGVPDGAADFLRAAAAAERKVLASGVPAAVLRFGFLYGDSAELAAVRDALRLGRPLDPGYNVPVSWVSISDAANALLRAVQRRPTGVTLNVVDDNEATTAEFMNYFTQAQGLGLAPRLPFLSALTGDKQVTALMHIPAHADNLETKNALGWSPRFADYRAGIDDTLLTWRARAYEAEEVAR